MKDQSPHRRHLIHVPLSSILEVFSAHLTLVEGSAEGQVSGPCSQTEPQPGALIFVGDAKNLEAALQGPAHAIVLNPKLMTQARSNNKSGKTLIASANTYLSMALVNAHFFQLPFLKGRWGEKNIHASAHVHANAQVDSTAIVGPGVVLGPGVRVGKGTFIGANTVIEAETQIGSGCFIHPQVYIGHTCQIGDRVEIKPNSTIGSDGYGYAHDEKGDHYRIPHFGPVVIEDDVHIGANVNIDRGTFEPAVIGAGTKIDNHCHFGHNVRIGKNCLITAGMITAGSVTIGDRCVFGGRTTVNGHTSIVSDCTFGGLSGINNDVTEPGFYGGYPLSEFRDSLKTLSSLAHVPRMRKQLSLVLKKLGLQSDTEKT